MRTVLIALFMIAAIATEASAQTVREGVIDTILSSYSNRTYTTKPVTDEEIDMIIQCGIKAPSARNSQFWKFTVVKDPELCRMAMSNITSGNILIVVSGAESSDGVNVDFDCALATQNMFMAAQSLGLGARIYMNPVNNINSSLKAALGIPDGYRAIVVLRVGNIDSTVDAATAASPRKPASEVVNIK